MAEEGSYASHMNTFLSMLGWYRNSLNCLQCLDFSSWAQTSEEVGEAPLTIAWHREILFNTLCSLIVKITIFATLENGSSV